MNPAPAKYDPAVTTRARSIFAAIIPLVLLGAWVGAAWRQVSITCATVDEPLHAAGAWNLRHGPDAPDFRINREDPPLWLWWASLGLQPADIARPFTDADFSASNGVNPPLNYYLPVTYNTSQPESAVRHARTMMLILATGIGLLTAALAHHWAKHIHGITARTAMLAATFAAALWLAETTLTAHAPLVKNDVALGGAVLLAVWALGRWWNKASALNIALLSLACAGLATTKFSGLAFIVGITVAVIVRGVITRSIRRHAVIFVTLACIAATTFTAIWTVYTFRFRPSASPAGFDMQRLIEFYAHRQLHRAYHPAEPPADAFKQWQPDLRLQTLLFCHRHQLLPEAYLAGLIYTDASVQMRSVFLMGERADVGWFWYFPVAWAVKTPLGLILLTGITAIWLGFRWRSVPNTVKIGVVFLIGYLLLAVSQRFNIGLRHLLAVYPLGIAIMAVTLSQVADRLRWVVVAALLMTLLEAAQSTGISQFNALGRWIGPEKLLSDSNLDWGQELPALIEWQKNNPDVPLELCYFGGADPAALGLRYTSAPGGWQPAVPGSSSTSPSAVLAVSATHLQGTYFADVLRARYDVLMAKKPVAKLGTGETIWLYRRSDLPP